LLSAQQVRAISDHTRDTWRHDVMGASGSDANDRQWSWTSWHSETGSS
jgi:hypothetical protein